MRTLLLPLLFLIFVSSVQNTGSQEASPVMVFEFSWSRSRVTIQESEHAGSGSTASTTPVNRGFDRTPRVDDPVREPNIDTLAGRGAALEQAVQESRKPRPKPVDGFAYRTKVKNDGTKATEVLFWEYQFTTTANPGEMTRRQFLCRVKIKPNKAKELRSFSLLGPGDVISVENLANKSASPFQEKVVINRVEFADGSMWQRSDWNFAEIKLTYARVVATPWGSEMCRGL